MGAQPAVLNRKTLRQVNYLHEGDFLQEQILRVAEVGIDAFLLHQLRVCAGLDNASVRDDQNPAGSADGGETVGNDKRRAVFCQLVEGMLDFCLRQRVERARRLFWPPERCVPRSPA